MLALAAMGAVSSAGQAQTPAAQFTARLAVPDSTHHTTVTVREAGSAASAVRAVAALPAASVVKGYRVQIFSDNSQHARENAAAAEARFKEQFPDVPVYQTYDIPSFKVFVGNCLTKEEAIMLCAKVEQLFNLALRTNADIPISELAE